MRIVTHCAQYKHYGSSRNNRVASRLKRKYISQASIHAMHATSRSFHCIGFRTSTGVKLMGPREPRERNTALTAALIPSAKHGQLRLVAYGEAVYHIGCKRCVPQVVEGN